MTLLHQRCPGLCEEARILPGLRLVHRRAVLCLKFAVSLIHCSIALIMSLPVEDNQDMQHTMEANVSEDIMEVHDMAELNVSTLNVVGGHQDQDIKQKIVQRLGNIGTNASPGRLPIKQTTIM